ncbi:MAG: ribosome assembly RNA-binding protein YhbY [Desulfobacteraceae bacterium]|nr:ribosome assembly RNA-binding protein YhbY [Desulfobacteraceae bacterium]
MEGLKGIHKKYLRGLAHSQKPLVFIGQKGISPTLIKAVDEALDTHELIKVKFNEFKEKDRKKEISDIIEKETQSEMVGMIGHTAIFYRQHKDAEKRKIVIPNR